MIREFNLLDEPWICVRKSDLQITEVSLRDAFMQAHTFRGFPVKPKRRILLFCG